MSHVNLAAREVAAKIVFYGPGLSGKTTTLRKIYETVKPSLRGEMMSLATEGDRTLFFDFLPVKVERVGDCTVRLALYTVPGQVFYNSTRKLVLQGADGVVFVADSQPQALDSNVESFRNLEENLLDQGIRLEKFPLVFQWNKRDIAKVLPVTSLRAKLNIRQAPDFETVASSGQGVLDALRAITRLVIKDLRTKRVVPSARPEKAAASYAMDSAEGLEDQVQEQLDRQSVVPDPPAHAMPPRAPKPTPAAAQATAAWPGHPGVAAALASPTLLPQARAVDVAVASGDHGLTVRQALTAVRDALGTGQDTESLARQAYLWGVHGPDVLRLQRLAERPQPSAEEASFALYVVMQVLVRVSKV